MMLTRTLGLRGESLAAWYLRCKGYHIVERNVRSRWGEIDLVVRQGRTWVFAEVKVRRQSYFGSPEEAVTDLKLERFLRAVEYYLWRKRLTREPVRIDLIAIETDRLKWWPRIRHLEGIA